MDSARDVEVELKPSEKIGPAPAPDAVSKEKLWESMAQSGVTWDEFRRVIKWLEKFVK